jgi:hypothetical protein
MHEFARVSQAIIHGAGQSKKFFFKCLLAGFIFILIGRQYTDLR